MVRLKRIRENRSKRCRRKVSFRKNKGVVVRWGKAMRWRSKQGAVGKGVLPQQRPKWAKKRDSGRLRAMLGKFRWGCVQQPLKWLVEDFSAHKRKLRGERWWRRMLVLKYDWRLVLRFLFEVGLGRVLALVWSLIWLLFFIWRVSKTRELKFNENGCDKMCVLIANVVCSCKWCDSLVGCLNRFVGWVVSRRVSLFAHYTRFPNLGGFWNYVCALADELIGFRDLCFKFISISVKSNEGMDVLKAWTSVVLISKSCERVEGF